MLTFLHSSEIWTGKVAKLSLSSPHSAHSSELHVYVEASALHVDSA